MTRWFQFSCFPCPAESSSRAHGRARTLGTAEHGERQAMLDGSRRGQVCDTATPDGALDKHSARHTCVSAVPVTAPTGLCRDVTRLHSCLRDLRAVCTVATVWGV